MQYGTHNRLTVKQALPGLLVACLWHAVGAGLACLVPDAAGISTASASARPFAIPLTAITSGAG